MLYSINFGGVPFVSDKIKPSDVGLEQEAQSVRSWTGTVRERNGNLRSMPTIKYLHLHECDSFSVSVSNLFSSGFIDLFAHWKRVEHFYRSEYSACLLPLSFLFITILG